MANASKEKDLRFLKKWYASGAIAQEKFPEGSLTVEAIGINHANGHQTLSLGERVVNSGPDWSVTEPIYAVVIPTNKKLKLGINLRKLPGNAVPVDIFFGRDDS